VFVTQLHFILPAELKSQNSQLSKLVGTTWDASASTLLIGYQPGPRAIWLQSTAVQCGHVPVMWTVSIHKSIAPCKWS